MDPLSAVLLWVAQAAGQAVIGHYAERAARRGEEELRRRLVAVAAARASGSPDGATEAQADLERYVEAHGAQVVAVVADVVDVPGGGITDGPVPPPATTPPSAPTGGDPERRAALESFLATIFGMAGQVPPGVVALPGALCGVQAVTVIDTRVAPGARLRPPEAQVFSGGSLFHLAATVDAVSWGRPRMWLIKLPDDVGPMSVVTRLTHAFTGDPASVPTGDPAEMCSAALAAVLGLPPEQLRSIARVSSVLEDRLALDSESPLEQATEPPRRETGAELAARILQPRDESLSVEVDRRVRARRDAALRIAAEQEAAGFTREFLALDPDGVATLSSALRAVHDEAMRTEAGRRRAADLLRTRTTEALRGGSAT